MQQEHIQIELTIASEKNRGRKFILSDRNYLCGRKNVLEISLDDKTVSSIHCKFSQLIAGDYIVIDLGSTNGLHVNGIKKGCCVLSNGDEIKIGATRLIYKKVIVNHVYKNDYLSSITGVFQKYQEGMI